MKDHFVAAAIANQLTHSLRVAARPVSTAKSQHDKHLATAGHFVSDTTTQLLGKVIYARVGRSLHLSGMNFFVSNLA